MTIYFANSGAIDLDVIRTMGVSVKNNDNPIGYFGTGLKYAIAVLLRTGHKVELDSNGETYVFTSREKLIRGEPFPLVFMNDEQLGFTTDLGKNWEVWQAYRELHSNCLDEGGKIANTPWEADTCWRISGDGISQAYADRHKIFLHGEPRWIGEDLEIHEGTSGCIYYRGVRVMQLPKATKFTYNFLNGIQLTEDRTAKSAFDVSYKLASRLPTVAKEEFWEKMFNRRTDCFENGLDFDYCGAPSDAYLEKAGEYYREGRLTDSQAKLYLSNRPDAAIEQIELTEGEKRTVDEAISMCEKTLNAHIDRDKLFFVDHLGAGIYGKMQEGNILIPRQTIANGRDFLMITLWEEFIHQHLGLDDCTRAMQQYLFDKVLAFAKEKWDAS